MKYIKVKSTDFYNNQNYQSLFDRLDKIKIDSVRRWGSMSTSQMFHHLNLAIGSGLGFYNLPNNSSLVSRTINKYVILNLIKRFPVNTQTANSLKVVTEDFDFEVEKNQLVEILTKAFQTQSDLDWGKHTYFGTMSKKDWGKLIMIHCNHHFQQFSN